MGCILRARSLAASIRAKGKSRRYYEVIGNKRRVVRVPKISKCGVSWYSPQRCSVRTALFALKVANDAYPRGRAGCLDRREI